MGQDVASKNRIFYLLFSFIYFTVFTCHKLPQKENERNSNGLHEIWR
nr:MAG TPA: hypothetical protein [Caudoviricetes sp.]